CARGLSSDRSESSWDYFDYW
nr:immunoglobulin heavy chain junction region [Macaca mulatta]MOY24775.1 immunoglobulin heavy chain junction region [Macaca mulatta]